MEKSIRVISLVKQEITANVLRAIASRMIELEIDCMPKDAIDELIEAVLKDSETYQIDLQQYMRHALIVNNGHVWINV